jgi:hypothetical protein
VNEEVSSNTEPTHGGLRTTDHNARYEWYKEPPPLLETMQRGRICLVKSSLALAAIGMYLFIMLFVKACDLTPLRKVNVAILRGKITISTRGTDGQVSAKDLVDALSGHFVFKPCFLEPLYSQEVYCNVDKTAYVITRQTICFYISDATLNNSRAVEIARNRNLEAFRAFGVPLLNLPDSSFVLNDDVLPNQTYAVCLYGSWFEVVTRHAGQVYRLDIHTQRWMKVRLHTCLLVLEQECSFSLIVLQLGLTSQDQSGISLDKIGYSMLLNLNSSVSECENDHLHTILSLLAPGGRNESPVKPLGKPRQNPISKFAAWLGSSVSLLPSLARNQVCRQ